MHELTAMSDDEINNRLKLNAKNGMKPTHQEAYNFFESLSKEERSNLFSTLSPDEKARIFDNDRVERERANQIAKDAYAAREEKELENKIRLLKVQAEEKALLAAAANWTPEQFLNFKSLNTNFKPSVLKSEPAAPAPEKAKTLKM